MMSDRAKKNVYIHYIYIEKNAGNNNNKNKNIIMSAFSQLFQL